MTDALSPQPSSSMPSDEPEQLDGKREPSSNGFKLRGDIPSVMRLSRKTVGITSAVLLAAIGGAFTYALQTGSNDGPAELYDLESRAGAEGLAGAPKDYSQIPKLGPPLPGDLGAPILAAQQRGDIAELPPIGPAPQPAVNSAKQLAEQERDAARISRLFLGGVTGAARSASVPSLAPEPGSPPIDAAETGQVSRPGATTLSFLERTASQQTVASERLSSPISPNIVQAGSIISAALITGIRSDLPGQITAQVTQNVYDSPTGRILLIPQGARLIGEYDADVGFGQNRVLLAWNRLILPDGRSMLLDRQPGADARGFAGLQDGVDNHWGSVIKAALISTVLGIGAELGSSNDDGITRALRRGSQDTVNQSGQRIVDRQLNVSPTLTIRPGFPVRVIVTRDLILAPLENVQ